VFVTEILKMEKYIFEFGILMVIVGMLHGIVSILLKISLKRQGYKVSFLFSEFGDLLKIRKIRFKNKTNNFLYISYLITVILLICVIIAVMLLFFYLAV